MPQILISGTDTGVGKSTLAMALTAYWQAYRPESVGLMKLLSCGPDDPERYQQILSLDQPLATICPLVFEAPVAPPLAADLAGSTIDLGLIWQNLAHLSEIKDWVFIEAVGGLGCPLTWEYTVADLAHDWRLPVILVAPVRLGTFGQVIAHARWAKSLGLRVLGIVLNPVHLVSPEEALLWAAPGPLAHLSGVPVWGSLPFLTTWTPQTLAQGAAGLDLEYLLTWSGAR